MPLSVSPRRMSVSHSASSAINRIFSTERRPELKHLEREISQPAVSKHLGVLKQAGLVRDRHEGRQTHYSAQLCALAPLIDWTSQMAGFWQSRFDHLEGLLKRMDQ